MNKQLYHKDVYMPSLVKENCEGIYKLTLGNHAKKAAESDRYARIRIPKMVVVHPSEVIEVQCFEGSMVPIKFVVRKYYDAEHDLCLVLMPTDFTGCAFVKTVWINRRDDTHNTLDATRYVNLHRT